MSNDAALDELRKQRMAQLQVNFSVKIVSLTFE
jgi:programmed cell death protein 5